MSRRPALVTQADIARALRAAKQIGAGRVEVENGRIIIQLSPESTASAGTAPLDDGEEIVL